MAQQRPTKPASPESVVGKTEGDSSARKPNTEPGQDAVGLLSVLTVVAIAGDIVAILMGLLSAFWLRFESGWVKFGVEATQPPEVGQYAGLFAAGTGFLALLLAHNDLYNSRHLLRLRRTSLLIIRAVGVWLVLYLGVSLLLKFNPPISRIYATLSAIACGTALLSWRAIFHAVVQREAIASRLRQKVIFVGWTSDATRLYEAIEGDPVRPYQVIGCVPSAEGRYQSPPPPDVKRLGDYGHLRDLLEGRSSNIVIVADLDPSTGEMVSLANLCQREFVHFKVIPSYFQILVSSLELETISGVPMLGFDRLPLERISNRILKRTVDIVGALVGLVVSAPLIAVFGLCVYLESPGPIFYRQVRTGRNGKNFRITKIRSMRLDAEAETGAKWAIKDDPRRLRIGSFLREWNLDETPQFWNVLVGDMSLVGPRPERPELIADFKHSIPHYNARHASKPGLTGWAQVHGLRGDCDLAERIRYDIYYLENWSLLLDFQIMAMTFLSRKNAY